jgi:ABC-2 type transport system permease protein
MNRTALVFKNEIIVTITRRSFLFTAFGVPLLSFVILTIVSALNQNAPDTLSAFIDPPAEVIGDGFVDEAGLIERIPSAVPLGALVRFQSIPDAQAALKSGKISGYYVIPVDFLTTGELTNIRADFSPLSAFDQSNLIEWVLQVNVLGGDEELAARYTRPLDLERVSLIPELERDEENPLTFFVPYSVGLIFYTVILMSASFLLSSMTKEKENRVMEILLISITPRQLLTGKIAGLGFVGIIQTGLWAGTGYTILRLTGSDNGIAAGFQLPPSILLWGLLYFILGYAVYASLMAGLGALVPNLREASQATFVIILPMILPLFFISILIEDPGGVLATGLSIFPFTAPVAMMTRLATGTVPSWQPVIGAVLMALTAVLVLRLVVRMFQAQVILSGQPFRLRTYFAALVGRA